MGWLLAFCLTQVVEAPLYLMACPDRSIQHRLVIALGASAITHPALYFGIRAIDGDWMTLVLAGELVVVAIEAGWLALWRVDQPVAWALLANASSVAVGGLIQLSSMWLAG